MAELQQAQKRRRRRTRVLPVVIVAVVLAIVLAIVTSTGRSSKKVSTSSGSSTTAAGGSTTAAGSATTAAGTPPTAAPVVGRTLRGPTPCPKADGSSPRVTTFKSPPPNCLDPGKRYQATFVTTQGNIVVALDTTKTPMTANNFVVLARYHYYDGTAMFRTDTSIDIIQGGSPHTQDASDPGPGYTVKDEGTGFKYTLGDLTMARTAQPNSASAQYFFCAGPLCSNLNSQGTYVTFGHTVTGQAVLEKILALNVNTSGGLGGAPKQLVVVKTVNIAES